jgi:hypothetical protein
MTASAYLRMFLISMRAVSTSPSFAATLTPWLRELALLIAPSATRSEANDKAFEPT